MQSRDPNACPNKSLQHADNNSERALKSTKNAEKKISKRITSKENAPKLEEAVALYWIENVQSPQEICASKDMMSKEQSTSLTGKKKKYIYIF